MIPTDDGVLHVRPDGCIIAQPATGVLRRARVSRARDDHRARVDGTAAVAHRRAYRPETGAARGGGGLNDCAFLVSGIFYMYN